MTTPIFTPSHEYADMFPLDDGESLDKLSDQIKANGLREPIVLLDKKTLDGRRRERACHRAGVKPNYRNFGTRSTDGDDPLEFVIDMNLHRRHLGDGDRALLAARYATAKSGRPNGKPPENQEVSSSVETSAEHSENDGSAGAATNEQAENRFGVSKNKLQYAKQIEAKGTEKLKQAAKDELVKLSDAAAVSEEPSEVQDMAVDLVREKEAKTCKAAVKIAKAKLADPYPDSLCAAMRKAHKSEKIKASDGQLLALSKLDEELQEQLLAAILGGRMTVARAVERREVPDPTVEEEIKASKKKPKTLAEETDAERFVDPEPVEKTPAQIIAEVNSQIESYCRRLVKFSEEAPRDAWLAHMNRGESFKQKIRDAASTLRSIKCSSVCPKCEGNGCTKCLDTGRVPKYVYDQLVG